MLFKKDITLQSSLSIEELHDKLEKVTEPFRSKKSEGHMFQGTIDRNNGTFRLLQTFDYGPRNQIRPEITGVIIGAEEDETRKIDLKFRIPGDIKTLLLVALVFNSIVYCIFLFAPLPMPENAIRGMQIGLPIALVGFLVLMQYFLNMKSDECLNILKRQFKATEL